MKKKATVIFFVLSAFLLTNTQTFAQAFDDGANVIAIGFGIPPTNRINDDFDYKNNYDYKLKNYGTAVLKYEHGLHKHFGIGLNIEYSASRQTYKYGGTAADPYDYQFTHDVKNKIISGFARFNGHFPVGQKLDFYGGVGLGYSNAIHNYQDTNPAVISDQRKSVFDFDYQITAGIRFMIKDHVGMFFEIGKATTVCQIGLAFKI
jgi:opacity protein-like surface antigen